MGKDTGASTSPLQVVTGARGFVGRALVETLSRRGLRVAALERDDLRSLAAGADPLRSGCDLAGAVVYHLAAIAHRAVAGRHATVPDEYDAVNRALPLALARAAQRLGARRFVFLSTAKVLGDVAELPLDESAPVAPSDAYSQAKARAESELMAMSATPGFDVVVLRPPLVYGPGVKANFLRLLRLSASGWPLPLGRAQGRRSFVYLDNLTDALVRAGSHPDAGGEVFHVTDGADLSVRDLVRTLAAAMGVPCRLVPVPVGLLRAVARLAGRAGEVDRLVMPCRLDSGKIRRVLGWHPPVAAEDGLRATAAWFVHGPRRASHGTAAGR